MDKDLIHKELSESIIGAAMTVLNSLRPGLDEKLYGHALVIELRKRGHRAEPQRQYPVFYDDQHIGTLLRTARQMGQDDQREAGSPAGNDCPAGPISAHPSIVPDLIVDDAVIVDCKVVAAFSDTHVAQMLGYLNITGLRLAILLNFKNARSEWKRIVV